MGVACHADIKFIDGVARLFPEIFFAERLQAFLRTFGRIPRILCEAPDQRPDIFRAVHVFHFEHGHAHLPAPRRGGQNLHCGRAPGKIRVTVETQLRTRISDLPEFPAVSSGKRVGRLIQGVFFMAVNETWHAVDILLRLESGRRALQFQIRRVNRYEAVRVFFRNGFCHPVVEGPDQAILAVRLCSGGFCALRAFADPFRVRQSQRNRKERRQVVLIVFMTFAVCQSVFDRGV